MEIVLLGNGGRDDALADQLAGEHRLHVIGAWQNPGLVEKAQNTGGNFYCVDSLTDVESVTQIVELVEPDMFVTNSDNAHS